MPGRNSRRVDKALTNIAVAYPDNDFIASGVVADSSADERSGIYYDFDTKQRKFAATPDAYEFGDLPNVVDYDAEQQTYRCEGHSLMAKIQWDEKQDVDKAFRLEVDKTTMLTQKMLLNMETDFKSVIDTALDATSGHTIEVQPWNQNVTNSYPIRDFRRATKAIEEAIGVKPNVAFMDTNVWRGLVDHPEVLDRVSGGATTGDPALGTMQNLASILGLQRIITTVGIKNTAAENIAASRSRIWGGSCYVAYIDPTDSLQSMTLLKRFAWRPFAGATGNFLMRRSRDVLRQIDWLILQKFYVHKVVKAQCGYRMDNAYVAEA